MYSRVEGIASAELLNSQFPARGLDPRPVEGKQPITVRAIFFKELC
jgi:hypothetical protein